MNILRARAGGAPERPEVGGYFERSSRPAEVLPRTGDLLGAKGRAVAFL